MTLTLLLYILAAICFFLAAVGQGELFEGRVHLGWLGAFLLTLTLFIH